MKPAGAILVALLVAAVASAETPAADFAARREKVERRLGARMALVASAPASASFRQDNDFFWLTGENWPDAVLAMTAEGAWVFKGEEAGELAGYEGVLPRRELSVAVAAYERDGLLLPIEDEQVYSTPNTPGEPGSIEEAGRGNRLAFAKKLRAEFGEAEMSPLDRRMAKLRLVKDASEIERLRAAEKTTGAALIDAIAHASPGMTEREFQKAVEQGYLDRGAKWLAFATIVGSGRNGTFIHYTENKDRIDRNELVVCDTGCESGNYAADVTRTFPVSGKFTSEQRRVYEAVLEAQETGCRMVKPGATLAEIDAAVRRVLAARGFAGMMPHATSHWVGLAVHDVGDLGAKLAPGMVLTMEPGIYLADKGIGVRIEDTLLVTEDGCENLSGFIPKSADAIEKLAGSARK